ncbi:MAG TPA: metalloregulator ArsR/SmtB family transcription factor [Micromonosporaceae bacterium]|nr:metalloregulator ArsR/SmtB family transcription factor [Micromonosporaceae bacterium]
MSTSEPPPGQALPPGEAVPSGEAEPTAGATPPDRRPDAGPVEVTDAARMRALAHPARLAILERLSANGPATATECAAVVSLSPSATSYHLRALARAGFVEQAEGRGDGRERLWRTFAEHYRIDQDPANANYRSAETALIDAVLAWQDTRTRQFLSTMYEAETPEWREAASVSERAVLVTPEELTGLLDRVSRMLDEMSRQNRPDPPPGARRVLVMLRAFPRGVAETKM